MSEETHGRDATINAVAAAIAAAQNVPFPGPRQRKIAERLAETGWLKDPADRAKIERLQKSVAKAEEFFTEHDLADWVELGRIIEGSRIRASRVLTPTDQAVLDAAEAETDAEDACRALVGVPRRAGKAVTFERAITARDARRAAVRARRVAAGGTAPTDPKEAKP